MAKTKKLSPQEQAALEEVRRIEAGGAPVPQPEPPKSLWSRRDFFGRLNWGGFGVFAGLGLLGFLRSAFPRVLFTPPTTFKAGFPSEYTIGEVSERFKKEHRVWIIRETDGFLRLVREVHASRLYTALADRSRRSSSAPATAADFARPGSTSRGRRRVRSSATASRSPKTASWSSTWA